MSDGVGRTSEQTLHSFAQPFKQPGVTMETPLCMFPNYPNPLHTETHTFWTDSPPPPSHTDFPSAPGAPTHSGHQELLDLVDGPLQFDLGPVVRVLHRDQDVEVLAEVLPVGLPPVHLLLQNKSSPFEIQRTSWEQRRGLGSSPETQVLPNHSLHSLSEVSIQSTDIHRMKTWLMFYLLPLFFTQTDKRPVLIF